MNENNTIWIWLKLALNDRNLKTYKLYNDFGSIQKIYALTSEDLKNIDYLSNTEKSALMNKDLSIAEQTNRLCKCNNIGIVSIDDDKYPELLRNIYNPPCTLFYYGYYEKAFSKPVFSIVGTRSCTTYGETISATITAALSMCGFTIACGVAEGIDTVVMNTAVKADGSVIAVITNGLLATGQCTKYKIKNLKYNGVVISEHLPNSGTHKYSYHERNRILSGISIGTLVTQAPKSSGALITANYALEQGRDVFTVPANIDMPQSWGSNNLIRDGAIPVLDYSDIIEYYLPKYGKYIKDNLNVDPRTFQKAIKKSTAKELSILKVQFKHT